MKYATRVKRKIMQRWKYSISAYFTPWYLLMAGYGIIALCTVILRVIIK